MILTDGTRMVEITIMTVRIDNLSREEVTNDVFCDLTHNEDYRYEVEDIDECIQRAKDYCKGVGEYDFDHSIEPVFYVGLDVWDMNKDEYIVCSPVNVTDWYKH